MTTLGFLFLNDLKKFKNYLFEIKSKPWKLLIYILYIGWMVFILYAAFSGSSDEIPGLENIGFKRDIFSIGVKLLVFVLFAYTLHSGTKQFSALFSMGDVNFLFPSPISPKVILAYSMIKSSLFSIISSFFILFFIPLLGNIFGPLSPIGIVYGLTGVITLSIFTIPFSYLTFILSSRFGLKEWLHYFLYAVVVFILGLIGYGVYIHQDIIAGLFWAFNMPYFSYIPIVGWSGELIQMSILGEGSFNPIFLVLQLLAIALTSFFAIYLAEDYYEDVLSITELRAELRKKAKEGRKISYSNSRNLRQKTRQVHVRSVGNGPWAFLWMGLVADKRINGSLVFHKKTLAVLILSIAGGIFLPGKSTFFFYSISGGIAYFAFLMSFHISMDYELKMKHIFVLPGQPWKKILAINIVSILKTCIYIITALLPIGIIFKVPAFSLLAGLVFPITMTILNLFSTVIIHQFIPSNFDLKAFFPIIRIFSFLLLLAPPAIAALWVGTITKSIPLGFYTISFLNLILSVLCLIISNKIFWRLEMR